MSIRETSAVAFLACALCLVSSAAKAEGSAEHNQQAVLEKPAPLPVAADQGAQESSQQSDESSEPKARHLIYGELLGSGILTSVHYEYRAMRALSLEVGQGSIIFPVWGTVAYVNVNPVGVHYLVGGHNVMLDLGAGATLLNFQGAIPWVQAGVRVQPEDGGFFFKASVTGLIPTHSHDDDDKTPVEEKVLPWPGLAFGGCF